MFTGFEAEDCAVFMSNKQRDPKYKDQRRKIYNKMRELGIALDKELAERELVVTTKNISQYWISRAKLEVEGIWLAYTESTPYYEHSQLNCGIYEGGVFAGIELSYKAKAELANAISFIDGNRQEFLSYFGRLDPRFRYLRYGGIENSSPQISESDLDDLVEAMKTESGWFAFGEWYDKNETCARRILEKSDLAKRIANIFEILYSPYLTFSGLLPLGNKKGDVLLRFSNVASKNVARKEEELAPLLDGLSPSEIDRLIKEVSKKNKYKPRFSSSKTRTFRRSPVLSALLKTKYSDKCQICHTTYETKRGFFTDTHHLKPLRAGGTDTPDNIVVVCPNHHRVLERSDIKVISRTDTEIVVEAGGTKLDIRR
jgi:hypothetical protein